MNDDEFVKVSPDLRSFFWDWCEDQGILPVYQGMSQNMDCWYMADERMRVLAILRWS